MASEEGECPGQAQAQACFFKSLEMSIELGHSYETYASLNFLAAILAGDEALPRSGKLLGFIERQFEGFFKPMDPMEKTAFDQNIAQAKHAIPAFEFDALWQLGRSLTLAQALGEAR